MSTLKVDDIQSRQSTDDAISLAADSSVSLKHSASAKLTTTSTGVSVTGTCTATTFSGSGASLTSLPAANLTGALPAIDGSNLTGVGGGAFEFVQKMEPSSTVTEIDKTGLEYDTLYKIIIPEANFNSNTVMAMKVFLDNATTMTDYSNFFGNYINESTSSGNASSMSYWEFNMDGYHSSKHGGSIDFYTGSRPYVIAKFINPNSVYGFVSFWGGKDSNTNNTNNDSNQTDTYAKANGFRLFSPNGWSFTTDTKILLYKYKEA